MKVKRLLLLASLALASMFGVMATAGPAFAGSCQASGYNIWETGDGNVHATFYVGNCIGVPYIQGRTDLERRNNLDNQWYWQAANANLNSQSPPGWFTANASPHKLAAQWYAIFSYRVYSDSSLQWGPWHQSQTGIFNSW